MAVLTAEELAELRKIGRKDWITAIDFDKPTINAVFQAMEDWYEGQRASVATDINTASSPKVFTNPEKKLISKAYLMWKQGEGG